MLSYKKFSLKGNVRVFVTRNFSFKETVRLWKYEVEVFIRFFNFLSVSPEIHILVQIKKNIQIKNIKVVWN